MKISFWIMTGSLLFWSLFSIHAIIGFVANKTTCAQTIGTTYESINSSSDCLFYFKVLLIQCIFCIHIR
jgi:hypothetical protein